MTFSRRVVLAATAAAACAAAVAVYASASPGTDDSVAVPVPDAQAARYCSALHARLPKRLDGLAMHDLKPRSELTAGWGDPLIVLRCGVPRPAVDYDSDTPGAEVDGVSWSYQSAPGGGTVMTTTLRKAYVELVLPAKFAHDASPLVDLAPAVRAAIPAGI
ncbi:DUF3515 domain-containing protein [Actinacidiphila yeochonensis]|uniref:DUF3515 domain-containing protein n=1 Tax=Actinacidiphila yeochonensis TaxID=89050 RepID=UPI00056472AB|nr:DUF3515 domain-containing protein [Actinacidiphila yeochonensis]